MQSGSRFSAKNVPPPRHDSVGFCAGLSRQSLDAFARIKRTLSYAAGTFVFYEGETPSGVFVLGQGRAKLSMTARDGRTLILNIVPSGEVLGLHATLTGRPHEFSVETMQPCQMDFVRRITFLRFLSDHSDACLQTAQQLSNDCLAAYDRVRSIALSDSVYERLARLLLQSSGETQGCTDLRRIPLALTHEEISQLIGSSREAVTRALADFRKNRVAELKGATLTIYNKTALRRLLAASRMQNRSFCPHSENGC